MANEATVSCSLSVRKGNIQYQSNPRTFSATVTGTKGPSPGAITAPTAGVAVDLSELVQPSLCRIQNLDDTNFVEVGIRDTEADLFFPLMELLPGESYVIRLTRNIGEEYTGFGTGTSAATNTLWIKADTAACVVLVEAFEV